MSPKSWLKISLGSICEIPEFTIHLFLGLTKGVTNGSSKCLLQTY
jgi:hypothetical protein